MLSTSERVGRWSVEEPLALEGLGAAFAAHRVDDPSRKCTLLVARVDEPARVAEKVAQQVEPLRGLSSDRFFRVLDQGAEEPRGLVWAAIEPLIGTQLSQWLEGGTRPLEQVRVLVEGMTEALATLRARGVLLGWLSPAQVMMDAAGVPSLALVPPPFLGTATGLEAVRYFRFLAPEALGPAASAVAPQAGDLYSLAQITFEALLGHAAFQAPAGELLTVTRLARLKSTEGGLDPGKPFPMSLRKAIWLATNSDPNRRPADPELLIEAFPDPTTAEAVPHPAQEDSSETVRFDVDEQPEAPEPEPSPPVLPPPPFEEPTQTLAEDEEDGLGWEEGGWPLDDSDDMLGDDEPEPVPAGFRSIRALPWLRFAFVAVVLGGLFLFWALWSRSPGRNPEPEAGLSSSDAAVAEGAGNGKRSSEYIFPASWRERTSARTWTEANFPKEWLDAIAPESWKALIAERTPVVEPAAPPSPPLGFHTRELRIDPGLRHAGPIHLAGIWAEEEVPFGIPDTWEVWGTPVLHVDVTHTPRLIPQVSVLGVWVDGQPSGSFFLGRDGSESGSFDVPVKLLATGGYHNLRFAGYHRSELPCESGIGEDLWSEAGADSTLSLVVRQRPPELELARWPYPFVDLRDPDDLEVTLVLPPAVGRQGLRAAGLVGGTLGREASWHAIRIGTHQGLLQDAPAGHLVVFAQAGSELASTLTAQMLASPTPRVVAAGRTLADGNGEQGGVIALLPRPGDPLHAMLAVVGFDGRGLESLGLLLASERAADLLEGSAMRVGAVTAQEPLPPRVWRHAIPPQQTFTLLDMGLGDQMVSGFRGGEVTLPIYSVPDERFKPGTGRLELIYSYSAQVDPGSSNLYVFVNEDLIGGTGLRDLDGRHRQELTLDIPVEQLGPDSELRVAFELRGYEEETCLGAAHSELWGTVHADTRLTLPRKTWKRINDLGLLRFGAYPFGIRADLSETLFVLPPAPSPRVVETYIDLATALGRKGESDRLTFEVELRAVDERTAPNRDLIVLDDAPGSPLLNSMGLASLQTGSGEYAGIFHDAHAGSASDAAGLVKMTLEEGSVPWDKERTVLAVTIAHEGSGVLRCGASEDITSKLSGRRAAVASCSDVQVLDGRRGPYSGKLPARAGAHRWIRRHYWSLVLTAVLLVILALLLRYRARASERVRAAQVRDDAGVDPGYL